MKTEPYQLSRVLLAALSFLMMAGLQAQISVNGKVVNTDSKAISNTNVLLLHAKDSILARGTTTNEEGYFTISGLKAGYYLINFTHTGYADSLYRPINLQTENNPLNLGLIVLQPLSTQLKEVTITGKKNLYEQQIDRLVINVKVSPTNVGNTVLEVLEKSPGVMVNRSSGSIAMNGKDGVMVMVNGKVNNMPQDAVFQLLNGINASMVERIELLTVPPSKYDAGGNAGYINIVMQANPNEGFNGNYSMSFGVGQGNYPLAGANFNYRKKRLNIFSAYSFSRQNQLQVFRNYRKVIDRGTTKESATESNRDPFQRNHNLQLGVDYNLGKKTVIGALISGFDNKWSMVAKNKAIYKTNNSTDTIVTIDNDEVNHWKHLSGNLNLQHTIREGEEFSVNADYVYYHNTNPTNYLNSYYDGNNHLLEKETTFSGKKTIINTWIGQFDYSKKLNSNTSIQWGAKAQGTRFTNDVKVGKFVQEVLETDPRFTANYFMKETIAAAYLSIDQALGSKTSIKAGLRYEYTDANLGSELRKNIVDRQYGNLFPTFYISHKPRENRTINFSYNQRINRPTFNQLAPFLIFFDPKTFISGNPAVQPSIMHAGKLDYVIKSFVFSASYAFENNTIARFVPETNPVDNTQTIIAQNMDYSQLVSLSASLPVRISSWWQSNLNITGNWNQVKGTFNREVATLSQAYLTLNGSQVFTLPKQFTLEASGFFTSRSFVFGANKVAPFGSLNIALQKKFTRVSGTLTLGVDNILNTLLLNTDLNIPGQGIETTGYYQFAQRTFKIAWTQNFGNRALKDKRKRATGADEIKKRVE